LYSAVTTKSHRREARGRGGTPRSVGERGHHAGVRDAGLLQLPRLQRESGLAPAGTERLELDAEVRHEGRVAETSSSALR